MVMILSWEENSQSLPLGSDKASSADDATSVVPCSSSSAPLGMSDDLASTVSRGPSVASCASSSEDFLVAFLVDFRFSIAFKAEPAGAFVVLDEVLVVVSVFLAVAALRVVADRLVVAVFFVVADFLAPVVFLVAGGWTVVSSVVVVVTVSSCGLERDALLALIERV